MMKKYNADLIITDQDTDEKMEIHLWGQRGKTKSSAINNVRKEINRSLLESIRKFEITNEDK